MKIAILTSSRADFGIYLPLVKMMKIDKSIELSIIAFGTHLSPYHGKTIDEIYKLGFNVNFKIESILLNDSPSAIASNIGITTLKFSDFWEEHKKDFDLIFALGDRYEMFAAVMAAVPFNLNIAHIHGGETTVGAMDDIFRHAITLASRFHFVTAEMHAQKVASLLNDRSHIYHVGSLSLDNLEDVNFLSVDEFKEKWNVDLSVQTILVTFHPETVAIDRNIFFVEQLVSAINELTAYQILITMPNADTNGGVVRRMLIESFENSNRVLLIENLGTQGYFSAMKHCAFLLGNTSSGIIEAASFAKYVINIGDRQKGRLSGANVLHVPILKENILDAVKKIESSPELDTKNIYYNGGVAGKIIEILKANLPNNELS